MIYNLVYFLISSLAKKKTPSMLRLKGDIKNATIENNISVGLKLLDLEGKMKDSSIKGNISFLPLPKNIHWFWKILLDFFVALAIAYLVYIIGWN